MIEGFSSFYKLSEYIGLTAVVPLLHWIQFSLYTTFLPIGALAEIIVIYMSCKHSLETAESSITFSISITLFLGLVSLASYTGLYSIILLIDHIIKSVFTENYYIQLL